MPYIPEEKHFNLESVKLTFLSFFLYKAHILVFFMSFGIFQSLASNDLEAGQSSLPLLSYSSTQNLTTQKAV